MKLSLCLVDLNQRLQLYTIDIYLYLYLCSAPTRVNRGNVFGLRCCFGLHSYVRLLQFASSQFWGDPQFVENWKFLNARIALTQNRELCSIYRSPRGLIMFPKLEEVVLDNNQINEHTLGLLPDLPNLRSITLNKNKVENAIAIFYLRLTFKIRIHSTEFYKPRFSCFRVPLANQMKGTSYINYNFFYLCHEKDVFWRKSEVEFPCRPSVARFSWRHHIYDGKQWLAGFVRSHA